MFIKIHLFLLLNLQIIRQRYARCTDLYQIFFTDVVDMSHVSNLISAPTVQRQSKKLRHYVPNDSGSMQTYARRILQVGNHILQINKLFPPQKWGYIHVKVSDG
jgi:hypothetical protein